MPSIDSRVVKITFDNAEFERGVLTTMTSLGKLNEALKFKGATTGLADVQTAVGKTNFNSISQGIEGVSKGFIAMTTVAITALAQLTAAGITAGAQLAKSLTLGNVISGFKEYETNIGSIQTILANTKSDGTNLGQVEGALANLNEYSDKTIYNFGQMTRNIGTFTAAGVDLDTSVQSIKGIANLAAISGSNADQASTAMYQLSQAVSTGTLKVIDWNSVTNAGMGGEVFQKSLFETGKALKTIDGVGLETTFEEWTAGGNSFRGSLETGWLTADVLTTTLQGFTGEMTDAQLAAQGFSAAQIVQIQEMGKLGVESATSVRTATALFSTLKETVGSGWAASFKGLFGGFNDATNLFSGLNNVIGGHIKKQADARNEIITTWETMGGRMVLVEAIQLAFKQLVRVLKPIGKAFREVFPKTTGEQWFNLTLTFNKFIKGILISKPVIVGIASVFKIFFTALKIGFSIIGQAVKFIFRLAGALIGLAGNSGDIMGKLKGFGDFFLDLGKNLTSGGGIADFFSGLFDSIMGLPALLQELKDKFLVLFDGIDPAVPDAVGESLGRFGDRFKTIKDYLGTLGDLWQPFADAMVKVGTILGDVWTALSGFFSTLGTALAGAFSEGDFSGVLDVINVGLLAGIAALLAKFFHDGFKFDITGGLFKDLKKSFQELTGVFEAMQTKLKAEALMKIATAIGILTASVLVLSMIDSEDLAKALVAMSVGFGQLMAAFALLTELKLTPSKAYGLMIVSLGMIAMAAALLILSAAAKIFSTMGWQDLAKGLIGVAISLAAMSVAALLIGEAEKPLMRSAMAMIPMAIALFILARAVKVFADMSWSELTRGLTGMIVGILGLGLAMRSFPKDMEKQGLGLAIVAFSLKKISDAILIFAGIPYDVLVKGLGTIVISLSLIGSAMNFFPKDMPQLAAGILVLSIALVAMSFALKAIGSMDLVDLIKGVYGMAASLLILAVAMHAMKGTETGALALALASVSLWMLLKVVQGFAALSLGDLFKGLLGMGIALAIIAAAALLLQPAIPAMMGLGIAVLLLGAGFALFGIGAEAVAKAFELFAKVGPKGAKAFLEATKTIAKAIPTLIVAVVEGLVEGAVKLGEMAPKLLEVLGKMLGSLMDELTKLVPKLAELLSALITAVIDLLREKIPEYILLGVDIVLALLQGIRDRIKDIVIVVGEIITEFLDGMAVELPKIVQSLADLFVATIEAVAFAIGLVAATLMTGVAKSLIDGFLTGLGEQLGGVWTWFTDFITGIIDKVKGFLGINSPSTIFNTIGVDTITGLLNGVKDAAIAVFDWFKNLGSKIVEKVGAVLTWLKDTGYKILVGLWNGIVERWEGIKNFFGDLGKKAVDAVGDIANCLFEIGKKILNGLWDGLKKKWEDVKGWLGDLAAWIPGEKGPPSKDAKILIGNGMLIMQGLQVGLEAGWGKTEKWLNNLNPADAVDADAATLAFKKIVDAAALTVTDMEDAKPVITPVLDLSMITAQASEIPGIFGQPIVGVSSLGMAKDISLGTTQPIPDASAPTTPTTGEVTYTQNVYAPKQLSTADIYKQTRNLIVVRKEELAIP